MDPLLRQAVILDIETLGLARGSGIHELAVLDVQKRHIRSYVLDPNAVNVQAATAQELTGLAGSGADVYTRVRGGSWMEVLHKQLQFQTGETIPAGQTLEFLRQHSPWLASQLQHHPHLLGKVEDQAALARRRTTLHKAGFYSNLGVKANIETLLAGELQDQLRGKTVWIANAAFESKQLGAQLGALGPEAAEAFKSMMETYNPDSPDPFYVTGSEVTKSRVLAQQTGDWTGVWRAYNKYQPRANETAVRDIQDVLRAMHSYGQQLGFIDKDVNYLGTSMDVSHQLLALAEGDVERASWVELHRAAEDVGLHEDYVLDRATRHTRALQQVAEGTPEGIQALREGASGPLGPIARYFSALDTQGPTLVREQVLKRLQRAQEDLRTGATYQRVGDKALATPQLRPDGSSVMTYRQMPIRHRQTQMNQVLDLLEQEGRYSQYGVSPRAEWAAMEPHAGSRDALNQYVAEELDTLSKTRRAAASTSGADVLRRVRRPGAGRVLGDLAETATSLARGKTAVIGGAMAGLAALGVAFQWRSGPTEEPSSILHYGYRDWVARRQFEGMSTGSVARSQRHAMTDFGSPYRGPVGSEQVFIDQKLLQERERWLRSQYGARHYNPEFPLNPYGGWRFSQGGYRYISGGSPVRGEDYGMKGDLQKIDLSNGNWKVSVADADTVVVKKGGIQGAVSSFFGLNRGYSFRLAGIDAPETHHPGSYHAPQPYAEEAKAALQQMLAQGGNQALVFDPSQTTYGRMLGAVVQDGRNLNYELVKRGLVAHLPYGNPSDAIVDYRAMRGAERRAYQGRRGMWSQPWGRAFYEFSEASGERVTFNTLTKIDSIVQNRGNMYMLATMEAAQDQGVFTPGAADLARQLGAKYNVGADNVGPYVFEAPTAPTDTYRHEQLADVSQFMKTRGSRGAQNKFSSRSGYRNMENTMVLDTLGTSDNIWTKRRYASFDHYGTQKVLAGARRERMAHQQRQALRLMNQSPTQHHRM